MQGGEINVLLVPLILMILFFVAAAGFGGWAFLGRQDYKNNVDQKIEAAKAETVKEEDIIKNKQFAEAEKLPLTIFSGPSAYGSIHVEYPKTWSVYVGSSVSQPQPLDAYFNPRSVPSVSDQSSVYALRVQVVSQPYAQIVNGFSGYVKQNKVSVTPYSLPKVANVVGIRVDGQVNQQKKNVGSMIILPLRDKTIEIWTEDAQEVNDFNNLILPNMTFVP